MDDDTDMDWAMDQHSGMYMGKVNDQVINQEPDWDVIYTRTRVMLA